MGDIIRFDLRKSGLNSQRNGGGNPGVVPGIDASLTPDALLQGAVHPVLLVNSSGQILAASEAAARMLGWGRDELVGRHVGDAIIRMDDGVIGLAAKAYESGRQTVLDVICCRHDGTTFPAECSVCLIPKTKSNEKQAYFLLSPEKEKADSGGLSDARLARAERLEMAGTLAGQIAHDFNNLLTPLLAYPELIRKELPAGSTVTEYIDIMEKTAGDMSRLTHQLLGLARRGQMGNEEVKINTVVEDVIRLMQAVVGRSIAIEFDLADNLLPVKGGKDQIRRVLENLCQNAVDAMGEGGCLKIKTENIYLDSPVGQYDTVNLGEYVKISISDTGAGIPPEIRDKIFDPFFTTKHGAKNRGSGLGLSIVHGIVRDHNGYIDLETSVGKGSTFFVYIPVHRAPIPKLDGMNLPRGSESVLVVDDDELQVNIMTSLLQALGYRARGVASGEACLRIIRNEGRQFDLVILDMILDSGMDGVETFKAVRRLIPNQKVMLVSGFSKSSHSVAVAQELGAGIYLRKPLTIDRVAKAVRDMLDTSAKNTQAQPLRAGKRILIVDDEKMIRKLFGMIIMTEMPDAVVDHASNGDEAIKAFEEGRHNLIIMDLQMPGQDGRETFAAISRLCTRKQWLVPPVIFCTGYSPPESLNAIINSGTMHCLLRKPVKADAFLSAVRQRLRD